MSAEVPEGSPVVDDGSDFVRKWRGAWPEWAIAEAFVPAAERAIAPWWQALQFELMESAWGGSDARPGEAKLGWWTEELVGWGQGRRRHPLGAALSRRQAPWSDLARALPALVASRSMPGSPAAAWEQVEAPASAAAGVEASLLGTRADARTVAACWLHARLARHPGGAVPSALKDGEPAASWRRELLAQWPSHGGLATTRRLESALARARLSGGDAARPRSPVVTLWTCWRAARD